MPTELAWHGPSLGTEHPTPVSVRLLEEGGGLSAAVEARVATERGQQRAVYLPE